MLVALAVLWAIYDAIRQPIAWNWLGADDASTTAAAPVVREPGQPSFVETVVPGPNDLDPDIWEDFQSREELVRDKTPLAPREMIAYWQLLGWTRTQSFSELEQRANHNPVLTQIWEQPQRFRGQPIRLRLHVRRVLEHDIDPQKNNLGVSKVYEAMGWTDESKSLPYTVVFFDRPPQLPIGPEVETEVVFVGYFLKIMTYAAFDDTRRGTPLLMGRVRTIPRPMAQGAARANLWELGAWVLGVGAFTAIIIWFIPRRKRSRHGTVYSHSTVEPAWQPPLDDGSSDSEASSVPTLETTWESPPS